MGAEESRRPPPCPAANAVEALLDGAPTPPDWWGWGWCSVTSMEEGNFEEEVGVGVGVVLTWDLDEAAGAVTARR